MTDTTTTFITPEALLKHWEGHRRLTRRVIDAFPEDQLFTFTPAPPPVDAGAAPPAATHARVILSDTEKDGKAPGTAPS